MENKQFPEQEKTGSLPPEPNIYPEDDTPIEPTFSPAGESQPVFFPEAAAPLEEALTDQAQMPDSNGETSEAPFSEQPETSAQSGRSFMERIPDVDEPENEDAASLLTDPSMGQEILPDNGAMDAHGMLGHGEEEPPFDPSILEDPDLILPPEPESPAPDQEYRDNDQEFDDMFQAPPQKPPVPSHSRPTRKGRPKRKKGEGFLGIPNILVTIVWLALIVAIGVTAGRMLWVCAADVLAFGREDKPVTITIYEADTMEDITNKLYDAGLIRYKSLFNLYASISDAKEDIQPGIYDLNTRYDYHALVNFMTPRSSREVIQLTIPEGYTCRQIFNLLEENRICTAVDIGAYAASGELDDYWFLENVTRGTDYCLEGFLFPDTYQFYKNSTPREALEKMLDNFNVRFSEEMRAQIDTLNAEVTGGGYTVREVTIVASLIEKESAAPSESPKIAGVIYNRLFRWGGTPAYLNIDAALVYAQNGDNSAIDTHMDSPYNTYTNIGLTPTPIANPGLSSLQAALNPDMHDYYYYVLNPATGMHQFSETLEEHEAYRAQFAAATEG